MLEYAPKGELYDLLQKAVHFSDKVSSRIIKRYRRVRVLSRAWCHPQRYQAGESLAQRCRPDSSVRLWLVSALTITAANHIIYKLPESLSPFAKIFIQSLLVLKLENRMKLSEAKVHRWIVLYD